MIIPLFDAHCDTISRIFNLDQGLHSNDGHIDFRKAFYLEPYAQVFAFFCDVKAIRDMTPFNQLYHQYRKFIKETEQKNPGKVQLCVTANEIVSAGINGKIAAMLAIEGAELFNCSLERLDVVHGLGVRIVTLVWNHENILCGSCNDAPEKGLSEKGAQMTLRMRSLGMITDVSHMSEPGFWDVAEILDKRPFIASHSNSKTICDHRRNLTDEQFVQIIKSGGIAGINLYRNFVGKDNPGIDKVIEHIEHFLSLGGAKNIGIGADFDGCEDLPNGISSISDMWKIYEALLKLNYPEALVRDIFYFNFLRVVREVCDISAQETTT